MKHGPAVLVLVVAAALSGGPPAAASPSPSPVSDAAIPTLGAGDQPLIAGTYRIDLGAIHSGGADGRSVLVDVPDGWSSSDGWALHKGPRSAPSVAVLLWDVGMVYGHPCQWRDTLFDPGPGVDALADALAAIPLRQATAPVEVMLDGRPGRYLEWSVPADLDVTTCDADGGVHYVESWTGAEDGDRYQQGPGQVDRLWILDVDGFRLVIDAFDMPSASDADRQELLDLVASIRFESVAPVISAAP